MRNLFVFKVKSKGLFNRTKETDSFELKMKEI